MAASNFLRRCVLPAIVFSISQFTQASAAYELGGMVFGLEADSLVVKNGQQESLVITGSGAFVFSKPLAAGQMYEITVTEQPKNRYCAVRKHKGTMTQPRFTASIHCDNRKISQVPIADEGLKRCVSEYSEKQGWVYAAEVNTLKCRDYGIKDISSLRMFPELRDVSLQKNNIVSAELQSLSQLQFLNLNQNHLLTLDISELYELAVLGVAHNKLESLVFDEHPYLQTITANDNAFSQQFEFDGLPALGWLDLKNNQLNNFSLNGAPESLMGLNLSNNPLGESSKKVLQESANVNLTVEL